MRPLKKQRVYGRYTIIALRCSLTYFEKIIKLKEGLLRGLLRVRFSLLLSKQPISTYSSSILFFIPCCIFNLYPLRTPWSLRNFDRPRVMQIKISANIFQPFSIRSMAMSCMPLSNRVMGCRFMTTFPNLLDP